MMQDRVAIRESHRGSGLDHREYGTNSRSTCWISARLARLRIDSARRANGVDRRVGHGLARGIADIDVEGCRACRAQRHRGREERCRESGHRLQAGGDFGESIVGDAYSSRDEVDAGGPGGDGSRRNSLLLPTGQRRKPRYSRGDRQRAARHRAAPALQLARREQLFRERARRHPAHRAGLGHGAVLRHARAPRSDERIAFRLEQFQRRSLADRDVALSAAARSPSTAA